MILDTKVDKLVTLVKTGASLEQIKEACDTKTTKEVLLQVIAELAMAWQPATLGELTPSATSMTSVSPVVSVGSVTVGALAQPSSDVVKGEGFNLDGTKCTDIGGNDAAPEAVKKKRICRSAYKGSDCREGKSCPFIHPTMCMACKEKRVPSCKLWHSQATQKLWARAKTKSTTQNKTKSSLAGNGPRGKNPSPNLKGKDYIDLQHKLEVTRLQLALAKARQAPPSSPRRSYTAIAAQPSRPQDLLTIHKPAPVAAAMVPEAAQILAQIQQQFAALVTCLQV